jgi:LEA14-like dessication related protein
MMDKKTKMALALSGATVLGLTLFFAIRQYRKIMSYTIKMAGKKIQKVTSKEIIFDLYVAVSNFADIPITMKTQLYKIYVNKNYLSKVSADTPVTINPKQTQTFPLRVAIKTADLQRVIGKNWAAILLQPQNVNLTVEFELRASLFGIGIPIKNSYVIPLKELLKPQASTGQ